MDTLGSMFHHYVGQVQSLSKSPAVVTEENVYQESDDNIIPYLDKMVDALILPGSGLDGLENLEELLSIAESGKSCLLLLEHYSNMDLSLFCSLAKNAGGRGEDIRRAVVAIAGMKLNEDNPIVSAFASAYSRIVIYPSRSLQGLQANKAEIARSNAINRSAMKALTDIKYTGKLILLFPSGTRYRPWDPSTKRGVREIDSYIKSFDYMCMVAINGEVLHVRQGDMLEDTVSKDVVRLSAGPVLSCHEFRERTRAAVSAKTTTQGSSQPDKKQAVVDAIMDELEKMHIAGEKRREQFLK